MGGLIGLGDIVTSLASVTNNVIDKISNAVGIIYSDSNYKMKKDSIKKYMKK